MILPIQNFCADLAERAEDAVRYREVLPDIRRAGAVYRADPLFEAGADLSDSLSNFEKGQVGPDVVREHALRVARLAVLLWLSVAGEEQEDGC